MRREPSRGLRFAEIVFAIVFVLPPALRVGQWWLGQRGPDAGEDAATGAESRELLGLREELRRCREEMADLEAAVRRAETPEGQRRFRALRAKVLPVADPSPTRDVLWVTLDAATEGLSSVAVVARESLVGRLIDAPAGLGLARVQSILDPLFRVRFRQGEVEGILKGTGRTSADGHPLLEVHHISASQDLEVGTPVFTAGGDGVYPPSVLIGEVVSTPATSKGSHALVRASCSPDRLRGVTVLEDLARGRLARFLAEEARAHGRATP